MPEYFDSGGDYSSDSEVVTEAFTVLKTLKEYFIDFRVKFIMDIRDAKKAYKKKDQKAFFKATKSAKSRCEDVITRINEIHENKFFNWLSACLYFVERRGIYLLRSTTGDPDRYKDYTSRRGKGSLTKAECIACARSLKNEVITLEKEFQKMIGGDTMKESGFNVALAAYLEEKESIDKDSFNALKYIFEASDDDEAEDDSDEDAPDLDKKSQAVIDAFNELSKEDKKVVCDLITDQIKNESGDDDISMVDLDTDTLMEYFEEYMPYVTGQTIDEYIQEKVMAGEYDADFLTD